MTKILQFFPLMLAWLAMPCLQAHDGHGFPHGLPHVHQDELLNWLLVISGTALLGMLWKKSRP